MSNYLKVAGAFLLSAILLYVGFKYFLTPEQRHLFFSIPPQTLILSTILAIPGYLIGGIELRFLYDKVSKIKLSIYDTITLPFVINLWGFILPFQGSFIYTITYVLAKYKQNVSDSFKVYLLSFSISMSIAGCIGFLYTLFSNQSLSILFSAICVLLFINPAFLYLVSNLLRSSKEEKPPLYRLAIEKFGKFIFLEKIDKQLIFYLLLIKIISIVLTGIWLYWVTIALKIDLTGIQLVLILLLMNITSLIKLTPGNIGVNQFASGGIAVLVGGTMSDGFLLSSFQYLTNIIIAVILGGTFSFINLKFLNWNSLRSAITGMRKTEI